MTETVESGAVLSPEGVPTPEGGKQPASPNSQTVEAQVAAIKEQILSELKPFIQSTKDKRIAELEKSFSSFREQQAKELVNSGFKPEEAKEIVSKRFAPEAPTPIVQTNNTPGTGVNVSELQKAVLGLAGLDVSDPDVIVLSNENLAPDAYASKVKAIVDRRKNPPPASTATQPVTNNQTDLQADYKRELATVRNGDINALIDLKAKYREKGLAL
jgi:hypothetical protein